MDAINSALIIQILKFFNKLDKFEVCLSQLGTCDTLVYDNSNAANKLAEILPVFCWKNSVKNPRPKPKKVTEVFNCFISTRDLFCWIAWRAMKG